MAVKSSSSIADSVGDIGTLSMSWRLSLEASNKAPTTIYIYTSGLELFRSFLVEHGMPTAAASITREHIEAFQAWMLETYRPASVRNRHQAVQSFFRWAVEEGEVADSPMRNMRPPQVPEVPPPVLTPDQLADLLKSCAGPTFTDRRDAALLRVLIDTGLRLSELAGLQLSEDQNATDVDLSTRGLHVMGKGRRPRTAPIGVKTTQTLDRYSGSVGATRRPTSGGCGSGRRAA